jgi:hypothetical protein
MECMTIDELSTRLGQWGCYSLGLSVCHNHLALAHGSNSGPHVKTRAILDFSKRFSTLPGSLGSTKNKELVFWPTCCKEHTEELKERNSCGFYSFYIGEESEHCLQGPNHMGWLAKCGSRRLKGGLFTV